MGVLSAFIFAAQMLNFTVAGGTSGHLVGGALAATLLGPWAGILTMTTVVAIQALLFQDGGLLVMGANILNMAIIAPLVGYGVYRGIIAAAGGSKKRWGLFVGGFAASVLSMQPEILALDEPTAGLDPRTRRRLIELLQELPQTMLCATHDISLVAQVFPPHRRPGPGATDRQPGNGRYPRRRGSIGSPWVEIMTLCNFSINSEHTSFGDSQTCVREYQVVNLRK